MIRNVGEIPSLDEILEMRENIEIYTQICDHLLPPIVGKIKMKQLSADSPMTTYAQRTDEAFLLLLLENNWEKWNGEDENKVICPYTETSKNRSVKMMGGWKKEGYDRYNLLCQMVDEDRKKNGSKFDREYLLHNQAKKGEKRFDNPHR